MNCFRCLIVLLTVAAGAAHRAAAQSSQSAEAAASNPSAEGERSPGETTGESLVPGIDILRRARMDLLIPSGGSHHGVRYPIFLDVQPDPAVTDPLTGVVLPADQPLHGLFECRTITRLDSDHLRLEGARWVQFDQKTGMASVIVTMDRGIFDMQSEILMSSHPVMIERSASTIVADSFLHDRRTGMSRFTGRVKMSVFQPAPEADGSMEPPPPPPPASLPGQWPPRPLPQP